MQEILSYGILSLCILWFAFGGYKKGIWKMLLGLVALATAYLVSFSLGDKLVPLFTPLALGSSISQVLAMSALFTLTFISVRFVPPLFISKFKEISSLHRILGACAGGIFGLAIGMVFTWLVSFALSMSNDFGATDSKPEVAKKKSVLDASNKAVAKLVQSGIDLVDEGALTGDTVARFMTSPGEFTQAFSAVSQSPELSEFWSDGETQFLMQQNDIDAILKHEKFRTLVAMPEIEYLVKNGADSEQVNENPDQFMAEKMSQIYRRVRSLRSNPEFVELLEDPEVKTILENPDPLTLLTNKKMQRLMDVLMINNDGVMESRDQDSSLKVDAAQALDENDKTLNQLSSKSVFGSDKTAEQDAETYSGLYKWVDSQGETRYTDFKNTPEQFRQQTNKIID